jgi:putative ABC transport system substrate-binding protein
MRRIGVFGPGTADDPVYHVGNASFLQALGESGWIVGRNVRIDYRWGAGDVERYRAIAADLVSLAPDAVLALGYATVSALQKATRSVPIEIGYLVQNFQPCWLWKSFDLVRIY